MHNNNNGNCEVSFLNENEFLKHQNICFTNQMKVIPGLVKIQLLFLKDSAMNFIKSKVCNINTNNSNILIIEQQILLIAQLKIEVLVPKKYNDGTTIPTILHARTSNDLGRQFGSYTEDSTSLLGTWRDPKTKKKFEDENFTYWVLCDNTKDNRDFLPQFKETLKERYQQLDI